MCWLSHTSCWRKCRNPCALDLTEWACLLSFPLSSDSWWKQVCKGEQNKPHRIHFAPPPHPCGNRKALAGSPSPGTDLCACRPHWPATTLGVVGAPASFCPQASGCRLSLECWLPSWTASPARQSSTWPLLLCHPPTRMQGLKVGAQPRQKFRHKRNGISFFKIFLVVRQA